ncbi:hypothetical protein MUK42_21334 [Musa troglodytarum]|uniref:Uncharacterized protein n=1 Tax=Musa troglodytarum TaxID=320322 RepID=A0A9E7LCC0_9LILI|nr:hypothetical protein MUK42_21334 [Musa troglodytarum]
MLAEKLVFFLVALLRRRPSQPEKSLPLDGSFGRPILIVVSAELIAEGRDPMMTAALVAVLKRKKPALEEELVGGDHRAASDRELKVRVGRRAGGARRWRLHVKVARERHARAHRRSRRHSAEASVINACHGQKRKRTIETPTLPSTVCVLFTAKMVYLETATLYGRSLCSYIERRRVWDSCYGRMGLR